MRGWVDLTAAIVEQAIADLNLAIAPNEIKRKPDWAFTPGHFREFFTITEPLFRFCGFCLNPEAVKNRLDRKINILETKYASQRSKRNRRKISRS